MSACKLQNNGCFITQEVASSYVWPRPLNPCQTLRRNSSLTKATVSSTDLLTIDIERAICHIRQTALDPRSAIDAAPALTASFTSHQGSAANGVITRLMLNSQALAMQQLSAEISRLIRELDTELSCLLPPANSLTLLRPYQREPSPQLPQVQQQPQSQPDFSPHNLASTSSVSLVPRVTNSQPHAAAAAAVATAGSAFDPLALATTPSPATRPTGLSLLSLSLPAGSSPVAASGGSPPGAGSRVERRLRKSRRVGAGAGTASSPGPEHDAKFKPTGTGSLTILMGSFSKDRILNSEEEQLLAAAAQDFMQLTELSRVLGAVLRRPPSVAEMAKSLNCEEGALRVRMDCGNRARTLLAQKNYRLVVNIAKKLVRVTGGAGGGPTAAAPASGGFAAAGSGGGSSVSSSLGDGGVSLDDAITVGMEALMHAIRKFKPEVGYRLSTYATWWIRLRVSRLVHTQAGVISMSVYHRANLDRIRAARALLRGQLGPGVVPSTQQLAEATGLSVGQVVQLQAAEKALGGSARSFEAPVADGDGEKGLTVEDMVAQDADADLLEGPTSSLFLDSEDFAASASLSATVEDLLASLDRGEAEVLRMHYGLEGGGKGGGAGDEAAEEEAGEGLEKKAGVVASGFERLKLGRKSSAKSVTSRALGKLRLNAAAEEGRLAEWLHLGLGGSKSIKSSTSARSVGGYAKKSKG